MTEEIKSGECPRCHTTIEDYGTQELLDMTIYYPFTCKKCGFEGREWYDLTFTGFTDEAGNEIGKADNEHQKHIKDGIFQKGCDDCAKFVGHGVMKGQLKAEMEDKTIGVYKENTRVELKQDVERYPHFIAKKGMKGMVIRNDDDEIAVKLDEKLIGSEEWENCVVWYKQDFNTGRDFSEEVSNDLMVIE